MRSGNPMLSDETFKQHAGATDQRMTLDGTVNKTGILLFITALCAAWPWSAVMQHSPMVAMLMPMAIGASIVGFILAMIISFKPHTAPYLAVIYAAAEGVFLGAISGTFEMRYPGIVLQAVALTFGTLGCLLLAYKSGVIKASENFKLGIVAATGAVALLYLVNFIMSFFGSGMGFINAPTPIGLAFSAIVVAIAALNLVLDFDFIEHGIANGSPKYMEWYAAFGLVVTLFWLYLEILRLLSKLRDR